MIRGILVIFYLCSFYFVLIESLLTCSNECSISNGKIITAKSGDARFKYFIDNSQFKSVLISYDGKNVLTASTTAVSPSPNRDSRFQVADTNVENEISSYSFTFNFKRPEYTDSNKILSMTTRFNNDELLENLTLDVQSGPSKCGPVRGTITTNEGSKDRLLWTICGKPEPYVKAHIGSRYFEVEKKVEPDHMYVYTIKLDNLYRRDCGGLLQLEATGYKTFTHNVNIRVDFTPSKVYDFDANYDSEKDCSIFTWSRIEAGTCPVTYVLKYDNEFDNIAAELMNPELLTYTKCGTEIGYNFSIKAVVYGNNGIYTDPISRTGTGRLKAGDPKFPWYYILIIVIIAILIFICILIICLRCRKSKDTTIEIEKANAIQLYLDENHKNHKASDNGGFVDDEGNYLSKSAKPVKRFGKKTRKGHRAAIANGEKMLNGTNTEYEEARVKLIKSSKPISDDSTFRVTFQNINQNAVKLYWKDYKGNEKYCHKIIHGKEHHVIASLEYSYVARDFHTSKLIYFKKSRKYDVVFNGIDFEVEIEGVNTIIITSAPELFYSNKQVNQNYDGDDDEDDDNKEEEKEEDSIDEDVTAPNNLIYAEIVPKPLLNSFRPNGFDKPSTPTDNAEQKLSTIEEGEVII